MKLVLVAGAGALAVLGALICVIATVYPRRRLGVGDNGTVTEAPGGTAGPVAQAGPLGALHGGNALGLDLDLDLPSLNSVGQPPLSPLSFSLLCTPLPGHCGGPLQADQPLEEGGPREERGGLRETAQELQQLIVQQNQQILMDQRTIQELTGKLSECERDLDDPRGPHSDPGPPQNPGAGSVGLWAGDETGTTQRAVEELARAIMELKDRIEKLEAEIGPAALNRSEFLSPPKPKAPPPAAPGPAHRPRPSGKAPATLRPQGKAPPPRSKPLPKAPKAPWRVEDLEGELERKIKLLEKERQAMRKEGAAEEGPPGAGTAGWPGTGENVGTVEWPGTGQRVGTAEWTGNGDRVGTPEWTGTGQRVGTPEWTGTGQQVDTPEWTGTGQRVDTPEWTATGQQAGTGEWPGTGQQPDTIAVPEQGTVESEQNPGGGGEKQHSLQELSFPEGFLLSFPIRTNYMYGVVRREVTEMYAFTACLWLRPLESGIGTPFSYSVPGQANELVLLQGAHNPVELLINDKVAQLPLELTRGRWWHVCVSWTLRDGVWKAYQNGRLRGRGEGLAAWHPIKPGGVLILGQEQDTVGGRFDSSQALVGDMSQFNLWDRVLRPAEVQALWECSSPALGNIAPWTDHDVDVYGGATKESGEPCAGDRKTANL